MRRFAIRILIAFGFLFTLEGENKKPPNPSDYGRWETLLPAARFGGLSPDGKWVAVGINRSNGNNELRLIRIDDGLTKVAGFGSQPAFSADGRWAAYAIGYSETQQEKLRKDKKPIQYKLGLANLATGEQSEVEAIESFAFSPAGTWLAMRRYPPEKPGCASAVPATPPLDDENPAGATVIVRNLANGRDIALGNSSEYVWQNLPLKGHLLALSISTTDKTGNGVQLFDTATGTLRVLDSSSPFTAASHGEKTARTWRH